MNGAESLLATLVRDGVDVCFANPGTSEMHFVAALDRQPGMRCVLGLFEGVVTGAADGYYRLAGKPAATLLHLGPGLGNGFANLHNARRARSAIVNVVGDHARTHRGLDSPLESDIEALARTVSSWVRLSRSATQVSADAAAAVQAAGRGAAAAIATLILPADTAWDNANGLAPPLPQRRPVVPHASAIDAAAKTLLRAGSSATLLLGGAAVRERGLTLAGRIATRSGCRIRSEFYNARMACGRGRVYVERVPYMIDAATAVFADCRELVLAGAKPPVAFFAYPGKPSRLAPDGCRISTLAAPDEDVDAALQALADALDANGCEPAQRVDAADRLPLPSGGEITPAGIGQTLAALLPENAVVIDEAVTTGRSFQSTLRQAAPHDWMTIMGGAIGCGLPLAVGAAVAAPDRKVVALEGDGSAMYTLQALWTMARESLDVTVLVFANRSYEILKGELRGVGATIAGDRARSILSLDEPALDWVQLARGQGVDATRATDLSQLATALQHGLASTGPYLIEVALRPS